MADMAMTDIQQAASDVQRINFAIAHAVDSLVSQSPVPRGDLLVLVKAASELASDRAELIRVTAAQSG